MVTEWTYSVENEILILLDRVAVAGEKRGQSFGIWAFFTFVRDWAETYLHA